MPKIVVKSRIPVVLLIDGQVVDATVTRFTLPQMTEFSKGFQRINERQTELLMLKRRPDELERNPLGGYLIDDDTIRIRRFLEMTEEERRSFDALRTEEESFACDFIAEQLGKHLRLAPSQMTAEQDGVEREITNGADFAALYGGRHDVLLAALSAIARQRPMVATKKEANEAAVADAPAASN